MSKKCFHYNWGGYCALCGKRMYNKGLGVDLYRGQKV